MHGKMEARRKRSSNFRGGGGGKNAFAKRTETHGQKTKSAAVGLRGGGDSGETTKKSKERGTPGKNNHTLQRALPNH